MSDIDFALISKLEAELRQLLEERPEYKDWFYSMRAEINQKAGNNRHNRFAMASSLMFNKVAELQRALLSLSRASEAEIKKIEEEKKKEEEE